MIRLGDHRIGWREAIGLLGAAGICLLGWALLLIRFL
jgi:hypothetical protein